MQPILWTPAELAHAVEGVWIRSPGVRWRPTSVRAQLPSRDNLPVSEHAINFIYGESRLASALETLSGKRGGRGCLVLPSNLITAQVLERAELPILACPPTARPLADLARAARARFSGRLVLVVGSVGKTTTRQMIAHALREYGTVTANYGNLNLATHVYEILASSSPNTGYVVAEMGLLRGANFAEAAMVLKPDVVVFTHLGLAHIDAVEKQEEDPDHLVEQILRKKAQAFQGLTRFGAAIVNEDMPLASQASDIARKQTGRVTTFGRNPESAFRLLDLTLSGTGSRISCQCRDRRYEFEIGTVGAAPASNCMASLAAVDALGLKLEPAIAALASFSGVEGRSQLRRYDYRTGSVWILDDSFNATPLSMRACLDTLGKAARFHSAGRRIAVLGDIRHLGPQSGELHAELSEAVAEARIDRLYTIGSETPSLQSAVPPAIRAGHYETREDLVSALLSDLRTGDMVAFKASSPLKFWELVRIVAQRIEQEEPALAS
ncbi:UDP-N-acetylmuramoyl-tripeptide--D-alanyl-D-alanine ligase [Ciceribacter sp. RN22]|uniref:UDP-N-acetylmuramoyl-tripeptide--D-alanyl-D- alanine ligase n=1 Tax=Ciceribacter sp. RN22 TaxID=2954932 RepID=UPI002092A1DB|nr:UDP-N-acetylmuramoyl-tripeptide--D-alanyl-D-alanine ligase [Ciceribacter sp. RN22]MCO6180974.1 UDP-N-acetylmuramoyl-tripeptide--D-alanyl-D-alanine ligase [Ciceribacter sp. RN22]